MLALLTFVQTGRWQDSRRLFSHTLAVTSRNAIIHNNLGVVFIRMGQPDQARAHFREALRLDPGYAGARLNLRRIHRGVR